MDPLDIVTQKDSVFPVFQGVYSADDWRVNACEVYGRLKQTTHDMPLGPFFHDASVPEEYRFEIDVHLYHQAIEQFLITEDIATLFLNAHPDVLLEHGEELIEMLLTYERERGLKLDSLVIEMSLSSFHGDLEHLHHFIMYLKTYGIKISLDNIGLIETNLDVIGMVSPHFIKVNLRPLLDAEKPQAYHDVMHSLTQLARKIGAAMIFQEIETEFQLQYAWRNGGQYYQGNFLDQPNGSIEKSSIQLDHLNAIFSRFIRHEKNKLKRRLAIEEELQKKLEDALLLSEDHTDNELLSYIGTLFQHESFRIYLCDGDGFQKSANMVWRDSEWAFQQEYMGKNWSWRPYFLENIVRMESGGKGILSDLYSDIETKQNIRTFSFPVQEHLYVFIDLSYEFLFKNDHHV
ncbi:EAL domain-containing protein [Aureibacillus halotolerans]|uniref:EAL domain-containing protein (Putative c-di-GMP-specific phosphodiesterase class I) n=1 Tax=Aureibacillus halotolerans TaxID=1508390 RepID=A0A4R6UBA0_9BACI|nr:EAL-associated domain-containing protein [Aureibacillus halotolerans]TDQ42239.1 EAL domain-containing protein (putative c-di-GMP-specific phosphodiesterase class I) [Aureibacillus halotolerans]